jgi:colanic acid/amylovoran biosynthesis protein WcaK/AmsJ
MLKDKRLRVVLLGASLDNDNMGVNVLAAGAVKCVLSHFPEAEISFFDYAKDPSLHMLKVNGREVMIPKVNIRFSKKVYLPNNIALLLLLAMLMKWIPARGLRPRILSKNQWLQHIEEADIVLSIAGGDSFSDIYGLARLLYVSLPQVLAIVMGRRLVLLPQTIGPFKRTFSRVLARYILRGADRVYARDSRSLVEAEAFCEGAPSNHKCAFCYDVGFVVDAVAPVRLEELPVQANSGAPIVGLNVSGLLFNGGYTHNNMFGLQTDYKALVYGLIDFLIRQKGASVLLVPHVFGPTADSESDSVVCRQIWEALKDKYGMRLSMLRGNYDQSELKYVIGRCDFFVGSRMHACIAAVSQGVPAVSVAYSDKFVGVMERIGVGSAVADARCLDEQAILDVVERTFDLRDEIRRGLHEAMLQVKSTVLRLFNAENGVRQEGTLVH